MKKLCLSLFISCLCFLFIQSCAPKYTTSFQAPQKTKQSNQSNLVVEQTKLSTNSNTIHQSTIDSDFYEPIASIDIEDLAPQEHPSMLELHL